MPLGILGPSLVKVDRANLDVEFEQRAIPQCMIAGTDEGHLALVLTKRTGVVAFQVMDIAKAGVRADDLETEVAGDVLFLQLHGATADLFRAIELAVPREQQGELQV